eukprot:CAMPEP_0197927200 /NCGR_PEP_ID=MMETSP1439-20131203/100365_1 /TAXON_ID=66791 /ORGANISM="Gonyaulax spinifera, Strain CCMP409" /LENGTH=159 /DNA_ID=CAMNT_0043549761 /DNA_START=147 /DNA_END=623 /DNA_ORIENTATION=-
MAKRHWMLGILIAQTVLCVVRIVLLLDILGGFVMAIGIGIGWYAYREGMNLGCICYWGVMSLINGAFDLVKLIDHWVKSPAPPFSSKLPAAYNLVSGLLLAIPIFTLAGAVLAYWMYKSQMEESGEWASEPAQQQLGQRQFGTGGDAGGGAGGYGSGGS